MPQRAGSGSSGCTTACPSAHRPSGAPNTVSGTASPGRGTSGAPPSNPSQPANAQPTRPGHCRAVTAIRALRCMTRRAVSRFSFQMDSSTAMTWPGVTSPTGRSPTTGWTYVLAVSIFGAVRVLMVVPRFVPGLASACLVRSGRSRSLLTLKRFFINKISTPQGTGRCLEETGNDGGGGNQWWRCRISNCWLARFSVIDVFAVFLLARYGSSRLDSRFSPHTFLDGAQSVLPSSVKSPTPSRRRAAVAWASPPTGVLPLAAPRQSGTI